MKLTLLRGPLPLACQERTDGSAPGQISQAMELAAWELYRKLSRVAVLSGYLICVSSAAAPVSPAPLSSLSPCSYGQPQEKLTESPGLNSSGKNGERAVSLQEKPLIQQALMENSFLT